MSETIRILGIPYTVDETSEVEKNGNYGELVPTLGLIRIDPKLSASLRARVLLHETLEAIDEALELNLPHCKISALAAALHQVLVDNPSLIDFLTKR